MSGVKGHMTAEGLEAKAEMMLKAYLGGNFGMLQAVNMERMAEEYFGLSVRYGPLSVQSVSVWKQTGLHFADGSVHLIPAGTILVDDSLRSESSGAGAIWLLQRNARGSCCFGKNRMQRPVRRACSRCSQW